MNKQATDFALMAGAFSKDHKMATQVCSLLANGHVNEVVARKMLKLVMEGLLASETPLCSHWHYYTRPYFYGTSNNQLCSSTSTTTAYNAIEARTTLTGMAQGALESAGA